MSESSRSSSAWRVAAGVAMRLSCAYPFAEVFERFTEQARQVVVLAQEEARFFNHNYIGTEHILLGVLREEEGLGARVLQSLDITVERTRAQVAQIVGQGKEASPDQLPFTPRAKKVLDLGMRQADALDDGQIATHHLLLGLLGEGEGVANRVLIDSGVEGGSSAWPCARRARRGARRAARGRDRIAIRRAWAPG